MPKRSLSIRHRAHLPSVSAWPRISGASAKIRCLREGPRPGAASLDHPRAGSLYGQMFAVPGLTKLIFLIAIICAVWYGFRLLSAVDRARRQAERMAKQTPRQQRRADQPAAIAAIVRSRLMPAPECLKPLWLET